MLQQIDLDLDISFRSISFDFRIGQNDANYYSFPLLIDYVNDESGEEQRMQANIDIHDQETAENAIIEAIDPEDDEE